MLLIPANFTGIRRLRGGGGGVVVEGGSMQAFNYCIANDWI